MIKIYKNTYKILNKKIIKNYNIINNNNNFNKIIIHLLIFKGIIFLVSNYNNHNNHNNNKYMILIYKINYKKHKINT